MIGPNYFLLIGFLPIVFKISDIDIKIQILIFAFIGISCLMKYRTFSVKTLKRKLQNIKRYYN
ncbi:hypothetical protein D3C76_1325490 [compost metagenome]